ncbi:hypothetical protein HMPREF1535_00341 [Parabacteroides goldsteinii DSM 19448 = WAL 12034]|uniref:Peptidase M3A/M3B catalytic domain-containing protein n=2 Tax=Parabacteroides goldsteinii TaxID=328812 RepID=A0A0F5JQK1_9BACT|nr:hypothetical protein [Parabacteroides goldsteinii]KKB60066.1 hypothetical protein HMPREF1535_00341 [Parabacteroides goldsteinii DSM 19448 = WAL 12034]
MLICSLAYLNGQASIDPSVIQSTISTLTSRDNSNKQSIEKGVSQVARLWLETDGDEKAFRSFCEDNYIADPDEKYQVFLKISDYLEGISGHFNEMSLRLQKNLQLDNGPLHPIDEKFGSYSPSSHLSDDLYNNKIAFIIALNFPHLTLEEKEALGTDRKAWAYARLGDMFTERIPAALLQAASNAESDADIYISQYNIYMGHVMNKKGQHLFPKDMILLSHWNLRDEIKANYNKGKEGLDKQRTVYEVMKRIISQDIPVEVINSGTYEWNPYTNMVQQENKEVKTTPESTVRYQKMLNNFKAMQDIDKYTGNTYIDRKFNDDMEVALQDVEKLFDEFLSATELKEIGKTISKRLGRKLEAYDIWYDGFKARSNLDETKLDAQTQALYPDAAALDKKLPDILMKLGFSAERANYLADKITVDAARGSGHAWGASMKGQQSRLRTRIPAAGINYKGYNIAIHEFGHNVEQTLSLYDVDYYMLSGVPNTAFTEALAFVFQKRDLEILDITDPNPEKQAMEILDKVWSMYEICGVSMLDISVWKWMYAHPDATAEQLKEATIALSKEIWNKYYAPVFGVKDETVLAVYSHMISYPLYLSAYAFGQIIEFQLDQYLEGKNFANEVERIFRQGRLTPNQWMILATGSPLTVEPMLEAVRQVIK